MTKMNREKEVFIHLLLKNKTALNLNIKSKPKSISKSSEESERVRKEGNALLLQKNHTAQDHQEIFKCYSKSIALAHPCSEELATAFYSKCSFLMHIGKYKEAIEDVNKALKITESKAMKIKLLCRKTKCFYKWNGTKKLRILDEIETLLKEVPESSGDKAILTKMFDDTKSYLHPSNISTIKDDPFINRFDIDFPGRDKEDIYKYVTVKYNEKNGNRYLKSNKDFSPGEIIYVEPFYAACLNNSKTYTHCQNCLKACWSSVPCDQCNWAMFCSKRCKNEAMEKFHDVECQLIPQILNLGEMFLIRFRLSVRMLIMAIKEAGSITKLRYQLKLIDKTLESNPENIYKEGKVEHKFTSVYSLKSNAKAVLVEYDTHLLPKIVVQFIKYSPFFGKLDSVDDILRNGEMTFIGTLLTKIQKIQEMNNYVIDVLAKNCKHSDDPENGEQQPDHRLNCTRGLGFVVVDNFFTHSCTPNTRRCLTEGKRMIIYALKPIKKGSKLLDCYFQPFHLANKYDRQQHLQSFHKLKCKCEACVNDWTSPLTDPFKFPSMSDKEHAFSGHLTEIETFCIKSMMSDKANFKEFIQIISKHLKRAFKELDPSCFTICTMITLLGRCFDDAYGMNYEKLKCY